MTPLLRRLHFELSYLLGQAPWDRGISPPELLGFMETHPTGRALDLGCGTGTNAIVLVKGGWEVLGIDFSTLAIRQARRKARTAGVQVDFRQGDVTDLADVEGKFDLALDIGCYHSLDAASQARYAANMATLIRPGGTLLLYGFISRDLGDPTAWLTGEAIERRFAQAFQTVSIEHGTDRQRPSAWITLRRKTS